MKKAIPSRSVISATRKTGNERGPLLHPTINFPFLQALHLILAASFSTSK